jgi:tRNA A-37 threonylcarbamoyl transferase component Bud32
MLALPLDDRTVPVPPSPAPRAFVVEGRLGAGGMGEVFQVRDVALRRQVAYKVASKAETTEAVERFVGEVQITAQLEHPNVVPIYGMTRDEGAIAYTMKLVRGHTLASLVDDARRKRGSGGDVREATAHLLEVFVKVCDAVAYAHDRGVLHRDLKPSNVMVGAYGEVYVMDWGIARLVTSDTADPVTADGHEAAAPPAVDDPLGDAEVEPNVVGTPRYMSPEQARGLRRIDGRSDAYSLGLILFEIAALRHGVVGDTADDVVGKAREGRREPLVHAFGDAVPRELRAIVDRATALRRSERYPSVRALADDVRRYQRGEAPLTAPDSRFQAAARWLGTHRQLALGLVIASVVATVAIAAVGMGAHAEAAERARFAALDGVKARIDAQAAVLDLQFGTIADTSELLAVAIADAAEHGRPPVGPVYWNDAFEVPGSGPADLGPAPRLGGLLISVDHPALFTSATATPRAAEQAQRVASLAPWLERAVLLSYAEDQVHDADHDAQTLIRTVGTPIAAFQVGLQSGGFVVYPGHDAIAPTFEPTRQPWYEDAVAARQGAWGRVHLDANGFGLVLPYSTPLIDGDGALLGVLGTLVSVDHLADEWLLHEDLPAGTDAWLVDAAGDVIADVDDAEQRVRVAGEDAGIRLDRDPVPFPVVRDAIVSGSEGGLATLPDGRIALWERLDACGWTYVVSGDEAALLAGTAKAVD